MWYIKSDGRASRIDDRMVRLDFTKKEEKLFIVQVFFIDQGIQFYMDLEEFKNERDCALFVYFIITYGNNSTLSFEEFIDFRDNTNAEREKKKIKEKKKK
jgi:hypothetical protein